ncbi:hypothetical protein E1264_23145 [Actinomadura sp. KC216]|uniref:hypothetical protein n=1 Tax=Actinomadura sp. KC216 TaxID=2530370 RepID=UPI0010529BBC|nr:hypothetical protein [Actinomadura sp. KC216]TDB84868.1 hypothetical protein E1264_23145 [Actinomadura sp. KC216]
MLERELPDDAAVLGLDEHTAALVDACRDVVEVRGRGVMTVRRSGESVVVPSGESMSLTDLRALVRGEAARRAARPADEETGSAVPLATLRDTVAGCEQRFEAGVRERDAEALVQAVLDIDAAVAEWAGDTEGDEGGTEWARGVMHSLVVRLGQTASRGLVGVEVHDAPEATHWRQGAS